MKQHQFDYSKISYGDILELTRVRNDGFACMAQVTEMMQKAGVSVADIPLTDWADLQEQFHKGLTNLLTSRGRSILNQVSEE